MKNPEKWLFVGWIAFLFVFIQSQGVAETTDEKLKYQDHGYYWEGIKSVPSSDDFIELLSVLVDYTENRQSDKCRIGFYLDRDADAFITVRETYNRHFYWLDNTKPVTRSKGFNDFNWPGTIIKKIPGLDENQLGVVVRIGDNKKGLTENVAPAVFYFDTLPLRAEAYLFTIKPMRDAKVTCHIFREDGKGSKETICEEKFERTTGGMPFTFRWDCSKAGEGNYVFQIEGEFLDKTPCAKTVQFYHRPDVGK